MLSRTSWLTSLAESPETSAGESAPLSLVDSDPLSLDEACAEEGGVGDGPPELLDSSFFDCTVFLTRYFVSFMSLVSFRTTSLGTCSK